MRRFLFFCLMIIPFVMNGQEVPEYEYDKYTHVSWLSRDSVYIYPKAPIKAEDIITSVSLDSYSAIITIKNNTDSPIYIKWSHVTIMGDKSFMGDNFMLLEPREIIDKTQKEQIQYCAIGDYCNQVFYTSSLSRKIFDEKKAKKLFKSTKEDVSLKYEITIPIIYKDQVFKLNVIKQGIYNGKNNK